MWARSIVTWINNRTSLKNTYACDIGIVYQKILMCKLANTFCVQQHQEVKNKVNCSIMEPLNQRGYLECKHFGDENSINLQSGSSFASYQLHGEKLTSMQHCATLSNSHALVDACNPKFRGRQWRPDYILWRLVRTGTKAAAQVLPPFLKHALSVLQAWPCQEIERMGAHSLKSQLPSKTCSFHK